MAPVMLLEPETAATMAEHDVSSFAHDFGDAVTQAGRRRGVFVENSDLLRNAGRYQGQLSGTNALFVPERIEPGLRALLDILFKYVIAPPDAQAYLPADQAIEVLNAPNRRDLFVAAAAAPDSVVLYRGDLEPLVVPIEWFTADPKFPGATDGAITDYGQTISFGGYEVAADAILYEFDPDYRRRAKAAELERDRSLGGAIRRLRLERRLSRTAFRGVSAKEIARIERGEVGSPHRRTLDVVARTLDVPVEELGSY